MDATELVKRIIELGADAEGIRDRFLGDDELYQLCFEALLDDAHFANLRRAMDGKDYDEAFNSAHALKGVAGNLGVSALYNALFVLVESLRAKNVASLDGEYAEVCKQLDILKQVYSGGLPEEEKNKQQASETQDKTGGVRTHNKPAVPDEKKRADGTRKKRDRFLLVSAASIAVLILLVSWLFYSVLSNYWDNILKESAGHVTEINHQIKLYVEERIENDLRIARSVGDSIVESNLTGDDTKIQRMLQQKRDIWEVTNIILYTEDGHSISTDGKMQQNDVASDTIYQARRKGEHMSIINSDITYTVPVDTELEYNGSKIAAMSVVQSMKMFLDEMGFKPFDGRAWMYLTDNRGIVISKLSNERAAAVFNVNTVTQGYRLRPLNGDLEAEDIVSVSEPTAFLMLGEPENFYVVSTPITASGEMLRLFYIAPEMVVNDTMNNFSKQLTFWSLFSIVIFGVFALLVLKTVYQKRKKQFDKGISVRERMFDLLIKNTREGFALFSVNEEQPEYASGTLKSIIGDDFWVLEKTRSGFRFRSSGEEISGALVKANEMLSGWNGRSEFQSGYILNDRAVPECYFEFMLYPVDGEFRDYVGIAQDVTKVYQREEATKNAMVMAEQANKAKSQFLSNMSHDIRTPMNAIMNMTSFALESIDKPGTLKVYLQTISDSSEHLLRLINDVLDMSRIESGQIVIAAEPFDLLQEMKRQVEMVRPLSADKEQILITDFCSIKTTSVCGDRLKFAQIIMNLLSNAVKFTPQKGAIRFSAEEMPSLREELLSVRLSVEDTGIGIAEDYIPHIFEPFSRADSRRVDKIEGTGLGLSICHSYVTAMGGSIKCESEVGEGTTFTVELFFEKAEPKHEESSVDLSVLGDEPFLGKSCLVGEDNATNQLIARTMLERLGFLVDTASDGWETAQRFLESKPGYYDVIYMDVQMPVMDGYQSAVTIRESTHPQAKTIPIIAMTANVFAEDIEKARIAGMDGHLGKPVMSLSIIEETNRAFSKRKGESE